MFKLEFVNMEARSTEAHILGTLEDALCTVRLRVPEDKKVRFSRLPDGTLRSYLNEEGTYIAFIEEVSA